MLTVDELLDHAADHARKVLIGQPDAEMIPTWLIQAKDQTYVIGTPWRGDRHKELVIFMMRDMLKYRKALSYSFISEAWVATEDPKHPIGLMPRDREDRREVVIINAFDRKGGKMRVYEMKRGPDGRVSDLVLEKTDMTQLAGRLHNLFKDSQAD